MTKIILEGDRTFIPWSFDSPNLPNSAHDHHYTEMLGPFWEQISLAERKDRAQEYYLFESESNGPWEGEKGKIANVKAKLLTLQFC